MRKNNSILRFHYHEADHCYEVKDQGYLRYLDTGSDIIQSAVDLRRPDALVLNYQVPLLAGIQLSQQAPKRILLLGLGGGTLAQYLEKKFTHSTLTVVDSDLDIMKSIASNYFFYPHSSRIEHIFSDAYTYLKQSNQKFDWILSDIYGTHALPKVMRSIHYYEALQQALTEQGVTSINLVCDEASDFVQILLWLRQAFYNQTLSHGLPHSRNAILYAFNDPSWHCTLKQFVQAKRLAEPIYSKKIGAYLTHFPYQGWIL